MKSNVQKIRDTLKSGFIGTAHEIAEVADVRASSITSVLSGFRKQGHVEVVDVDYSDKGYKRNIYKATPQIFDDSIPSVPPKVHNTTRRPGKANRAEGLTGMRGIICAVIADAAKDAKRGKQEAREWFESEYYSFYMDFLGLNPEMRPLFMEESS